MNNKMTILLLSIISLTAIQSSNSMFHSKKLLTSPTINKTLIKALQNVCAPYKSNAELARFRLNYMQCCMNKNIKNNQPYCSNPTFGYEPSYCHCKELASNIPDILVHQKDIKDQAAKLKIKIEYTNTLS